MTDHDTHRLIGELRGALEVLSRLVGALDERHHGTYGAVSEMRAQIVALTRRVDAMSDPVQRSSLADAAQEGGERAVASATAQRLEVVRTVAAVAGLVATLVSMVFGAGIWLITQGGFTP